jgi:hypothetical protein
MCAPPEHTLTDSDYCIQDRDSDGIWFTECPVGEYCKISDGDALTTTECSPEKSMSLPGEVCSADEDCHYYREFGLKCSESNLCEGKGLG